MTNETTNDTTISEYLAAVPPERFDIWTYLEHWNGSFAGCAITHAYVAVQETPPTTYEDLARLPAWDADGWVMDIDGVLDAGTMVSALAEETGLTTGELREMEERAIEAGNIVKHRYWRQYTDVDPDEYDRVGEDATAEGNRVAQATAVAWFAERGL